MLHFCFSLLFAASASADYVTGYQAPAAAAQAPPPTSITALSEPTLDAAFSSQDAYYATAMPSFGTGPAAEASESAFLAAEAAFYDSAYPAQPSPTGPDACGPQIPDPSVPDSCDTPIEQTDQPAAWGVQCLNDTQTPNTINITACAALIVEVCANQWQHPDEWVWLTANGCSIGSYLPSMPGHAPWPQQAVCEQLIYASMVDSCEYSGYPYNIAAVNLRVLPSNAYKNSGGTGVAVNSGYGSYIVAARQQRAYSDLTGCVGIPLSKHCIGDCKPSQYFWDKYGTTAPCDEWQSTAAIFTPAPGHSGTLAVYAPAEPAPTGP